MSKESLNHHRKRRAVRDITVDAVHVAENMSRRFAAKVCGDHDESVEKEFLAQFQEGNLKPDLARLIGSARASLSMSEIIHRLDSCGEHCFATVANPRGMSHARFLQATAPIRIICSHFRREYPLHGPNSSVNTCVDVMGFLILQFGNLPITPDFEKVASQVVQTCPVYGRKRNGQYRIQQTLCIRPSCSSFPTNPTSKESFFKALVLNLQDLGMQELATQVENMNSSGCPLTEIAKLIRVQHEMTPRKVSPKIEDKMDVSSSDGPSPKFDSLSPQAVDRHSPRDQGSSSPFTSKSSSQDESPSPQPDTAPSPHSHSPQFDQNFAHASGLDVLALAAEQLESAPARRTPQVKRKRLSTVGDSTPQSVFRSVPNDEVNSDTESDPDDSDDVFKPSPEPSPKEQNVDVNLSPKLPAKEAATKFWPFQFPPAVTESILWFIKQIDNKHQAKLLSALYPRVADGLSVNNDGVVQGYDMKLSEAFRSLVENRYDAHAIEGVTMSKALRFFNKKQGHILASFWCNTGLRSKSCHLLLPGDSTSFPVRSHFKFNSSDYSLVLYSLFFASVLGNNFPMSTDFMKSGKIFVRSCDTYGVTSNCTRRDKHGSLCVNIGCCQFTPLESPQAFAEFRHIVMERILAALQSIGVTQQTVTMQQLLAQTRAFHHYDFLIWVYSLFRDDDQPNPPDWHPYTQKYRTMYQPSLSLRLRRLSVKEEHDDMPQVARRPDGAPPPLVAAPQQHPTFSPGPPLPISTQHRMQTATSPQHAQRMQFPGPDVSGWRGPTYPGVPPYFGGQGVRGPVVMYRDPRTGQVFPVVMPSSHASPMGPSSSGQYPQVPGFPTPRQRMSAPQSQRSPPSYLPEVRAQVPK